MGRTRPSVLVACASDWTSPARLPRVLKQAGARVTAVSAAGRPLATTWFIDTLVEAPVELDAFVDVLRAHLADTRPDLVLITDDPLLAALRDRRDEEWTRGLLPIAGEHPWADILASKAAFCELGARAGLPLPASRVCSDLDDARRAAGELGLPLILKQSAGFGGVGVRLVHEAGELDEAWRALAADTVVAQRFVEGPIGNSVFLMDRGRPICWMSAYKTRTFPGAFGPSSARRFMVHPDVAPLLERIGALTGYHGFGAVDWVLAADGHLRVIELNARPVPTIHMGPLAGVDFARAVRGLLAGAPSVQAPRPPPDAARVHAMFPEDLFRAGYENAFDVRDWLPGRDWDVPWYDPPLLWHFLVRLYRGYQQLGRERSSPSVSR